ncbi:MAG: DoxX family protein [Actinomycetia bacterium]|nr:DoxX family protein [Actinomycetes bacterium]
MDDINLGILILRVAAGVTMAMHGYAKVFKGGKLPGVAGWCDSMGMRPGKLHAPLAAFTPGLRLGDAYQRLLGHRVDAVVVDGEAEDKADGTGFLVEESVRLVHRHQPVARNALVRAVAVV